MAAGGGGHLSMAEVQRGRDERDLDLAQRLQLNQMRVLISLQAWEQDKAALKKNLQHLVRRQPTIAESA